MGYYVERSRNGIVIGLYASLQEGFAEEFLGEGHPDVVGFLNPPERLQPITKRQLRLTLVRSGISLALVDAAIAAMPEGLPKQEAKIEWADASTFNRNHPTLLLIAESLGLSDDEVDEMWRHAATA